MTTQPSYGNPGELEPLKQAAIDRLTEAFAADRIDMDEYERRAALANAARLPRELDELTADLPAVSRASGRPAAPRRPEPSRGAESHGLRVNPDLAGGAPMTTGCVMGDRHLAGNWLSGDRVSSFTVMGSTKIDLREVDLPPGPLKIEVFTLMGETRIIVPRGLPVRMSAFALMAESRVDREVEQQTRGAESWVEVSGFAMMGELRVTAKG